MWNVYTSFLWDDKLHICSRQTQTLYETCSVNEQDESRGSEGGGSTHPHIQELSQHLPGTGHQGRHTINCNVMTKVYDYTQGCRQGFGGLWKKNLFGPQHFNTENQASPKENNTDMDQYSAWICTWIMRRVQAFSRYILLFLIILLLDVILKNVKCLQ